MAPAVKLPYSLGDTAALSSLLAGKEYTQYCVHERISLSSHTAKQKLDVFCVACETT